MKNMHYYCFLLTESGFKLTQKNRKQTEQVLLSSKTDSFKEKILRLKVPLLNTKQRSKLEQIQNKVSYEDFKKILKAHNNQTVSYFDKLYPVQLTELYDPPLLLYYRGSLNATTQHTNLAVVGNRRITQYGKQVTAQLLRPLARAPLTIVSGMAYGVDALAHQTALENNLPTVAVLGNGLSEPCMYPKANQMLSKKIADSGGLLISEYPPEQSARGFQFVARNRIIAGLSSATLITECKIKSGSLITAEYCLDLGRQVLAVPGAITHPASEGPNNLIAHGATPITTAKQLAEILSITLPDTTSVDSQHLSKPEQHVLKCMHNQATSLEELATITEMNTTLLLSTLSKLELKNIIESPHAGSYALK